MPAKNETEVVIGGKSFKLSGYESEEYLQKVAAYIKEATGCTLSDEEVMYLSVHIRRVTAVEK